MKKIVLRIIPIIFLFQASLAQAYIEAEPYIGADLQIRQTRFKKNFGSNLFNKNLVQINPYVGLMFCENIGLEFGYEHGFHKNANSVTRAGDIVLGVTQDADLMEEHATSSLEIFGPNLNIVGILPICPDYGTSLYASFGFARLKTKITYQPTSADEEIFDTPLLLSGVRQDFRKTKNVLRITAGIQQMVSQCAGIRASIGWENTSKFKNLHSKQATGSVATLKDSINYGIGVFWKF